MWLNRAILDTSHNLPFATLVRPEESGEVRAGVTLLRVRIARSCNPLDRGSSMTQQISALRQRMIDDMTIRNMSPGTKYVYIRAVKNFSLHFGRSPDKLTFVSR